MLERSCHYDTYPREVSDFTEKIIESLEAEKFFEQEDANVDITFQIFADLIFSKWAKGDSLDDFSGQEFDDALKRSIVESDLSSLKEKGLIDSIEDLDGEERYFLTKEGKKKLNKYIGENPD